jgi:hypothetical protein
MRNYLKVGLLHLMVLFSACHDQLHLPPAQSVDQDIALSSDANVKAVLVGAYDKISQYSLYGGNIFLLAEMAAANKEIRWQGTYTQPREVFNKDIFTNNSFITDLWTEAYAAINTANNIIEAIGVVNIEDQDQVKGEALFIRGAMFFELTRFFAQPFTEGDAASNLSIPLILTPTRGVDESSYVSRATVQEAYDQIVSDLTTAESLLPAANGFFASKSAAAAMLSRVYLQMEKFADARDAAHRVINGSGKSLTPTYAEAFNNTQNSSEDLFAIQVSAQDGSNYMHLFYSIPEFGGRGGDVVPLPAHLNQYEAGDQRRDLYYIGNEDVRVGKWKQEYRNLPLIRLAEMYLTRAEGNFREGTAIGVNPVSDINMIRKRVKLPLKSTITLEEILKERKLELAHEGHSLHDVKRTRGSIVDNSSAEVYRFDDPRLVFPIPQREMDANPNLVQNEGYGS